jgi:acylglycerol lipase
MVDPSLAEELMEKSPSTDKTLIYRENMWHNVIQEEEIEEIIP